MATLDWPTDPPTLATLGPDDTGEDAIERLRPWADRDVDAMFAACQDPDIQGWTTVPVPYLVEHARDFVIDVAPAQWAARSGALFCIASAGDDQVLGSCGLVSVDAENAVAQIGYWVAPEARGAGVATRSVAALTSWALDDVGVRRLELHIDPDNKASRAVPQRLGWCRESRRVWALPSR